MDSIEEHLDTLLYRQVPAQEKALAVRSLRSLIVDAPYLLDRLQQQYEKGLKQGKWHQPFPVFLKEIVGLVLDGSPQISSPRANYLQAGAILLVQKQSSFQSASRALLLRWLNQASHGAVRKALSISNPLQQVSRLIQQKIRQHLQQPFIVCRRVLSIQRASVKLALLYTLRMESAFLLTKMVAQNARAKFRLLRQERQLAFSDLQPKLICAYKKDAFRRIKTASKQTLLRLQQQEQSEKAKRTLILSAINLKLNLSLHKNIVSAFFAIKAKKRLNKRQTFQLMVQQSKNFLNNKLLLSALRLWKRKALRKTIEQALLSHSISRSFLTKLEQCSVKRLLPWFLRWWVRACPRPCYDLCSHFIKYKTLTPATYLFRSMKARAIPFLNKEKKSPNPNALAITVLRIIEGQARQAFNQVVNFVQMARYKCVKAFTQTLDVTARRNIREVLDILKVKNSSMFRGISALEQICLRRQFVKIKYFSLHSAIEMAADSRYRELQKQIYITCKKRAARFALLCQLCSLLDRTVKLSLCQGLFKIKKRAQATSVRTSLQRFANSLQHCLRKRLEDGMSLVIKECLRNTEAHYDRVCRVASKLLNNSYFARKQRYLKQLALLKLKHRKIAKSAAALLIHNSASNGIAWRKSFAISQLRIVNGRAGRAVTLLNRLNSLIRKNKLSVFFNKVRSVPLGILSLLANKKIGQGLRLILQFTLAKRKDKLQRLVSILGRLRADFKQQSLRRLELDSQGGLQKLREPFLKSMRRAWSKIKLSRNYDLLSLQFGMLQLSDLVESRRQTALKWGVGRIKREGEGSRERWNLRCLECGWQSRLAVAVQ